MKIIIMFATGLWVDFIVGSTGPRPSSIGIREGSLTPCPGRPNCVSSQARDKRHFVKPFRYTSGKDEAFEALKRMLSTQQQATVVEERDNYLYAEFKTTFFRLVDDVEFYFPADEPVIHVRSASRLGYSDLGVNRRRVERLRTLFIQQGQSI